MRWTPHLERLCFTLTVLLSTIQCTWGQTIEVKGIVADSTTLQPLESVLIIVKGTNRGTVSDKNGNFALTASRDDTILFRMVGYREAEATLADWETSMVLLSEDAKLLDAVVVQASPMTNPYKILFSEEIKKYERLRKPLPFYYSKQKKEKALVSRQAKEKVRTKTYADLIVVNPTVKEELKTRYRLSDDQYYDILRKFNERNYEIMYYLSAPELLSMLNRFFDSHAP